jgi:hypothetical protein
VKGRSEPGREQRESAMWSDIDRAFSEPVIPSDREADYVPTQIIAELFKANGFDGIAYRSTFGEKGFNVALFDLATAEAINCSLYEAKNAQPCVSSSSLLPLSMVEPQQQQQTKKRKECVLKDDIGVQCETEGCQKWRKMNRAVYNEIMDERDKFFCTDLHNTFCYQKCDYCKRSKCLCNK